jgi:hypothetical protein
VVRQHAGQLATALKARGAFGQHVQQGLADHPFHHHVAEFAVVFDIEHLGETRVAEPARGMGGGDRLGDVCRR